MLHYQVYSRADYRLEVTVHSYSNPGGKCARFGGKCCENFNEDTCEDNTADPYFIFCLGTVGESGSNTSQCQLGRKESNMEFNNIVSLTFTTGSSALFGLPNPLPFVVSGSLPVRQ